MSDRLFSDRREAGRFLAGLLDSYRGRTDVVVAALPRGGVPVASDVAEALGAPLDTFLVRKLGVPGHEELAMGAILSGGVVVLDDDVVRGLAICAPRPPHLSSPLASPIVARAIPSRVGLGYLPAPRGSGALEGVWVKRLHRLARQHKGETTWQSS